MMSNAMDEALANTIKKAKECAMRLILMKGQIAEVLPTNLAPQTKFVQLANTALRRQRHATRNSRQENDVMTITLVGLVMDVSQTLKHMIRDV